MIFYDAKHKEFFLKNTAGVKCDAYSLPVIYLLALTEETRRNFNRIYDIKKNEINPDQLNQPWQTGNTKKITRLAFNLFNETVYDSEEDYKNNVVSKYFAVEEIFCCGFAPFFWEAIKLRYPEYCKNEGIK